jgi:Fur family ferric uptake transcriptional regulator
MKQIHLREKEQFKILFQQENIDRVDDRFAILEVFLQNEHHLTADEMQSRLRAQGLSFDSGFVEETLELMCQFGFARKNRFDNGQFRYEHHHLGHHHDHMICTKCGVILEFHNPELEMLQLKIASSHGFHMLQHRMEIYGLCSGCRREHLRQIPLPAARQGELLRIASFTGGAGSRLRLMSMGLRPGDTFEVISNLNQGQVVVAAGEKRFVLGKGLAEKILAERVAEPQEAPAAESLPDGPSAPMPMSRMREGQRAFIVKVGGNGALRRRLLEMGLTKGTPITVEKYAPLKDPLELVVKGYHITLRVEEAEQIVVDHVQ